MKAIISKGVVCVVSVLAGIVVPATTVLAFGWSTHAKIADVEKCSLCSYYSKPGSVTPDLAWWLEGAGIVDEDTAICIHTHAFSESAPERLTLWNFRRLFFLKGAHSHCRCGNGIANMYIPFWIEAFQNQFNGAGASILEGLTAEEIEVVLEEVFEYVMDARVVDAFGFQINDLVFLNWAARFVENQVEEGCFDGRYPGFDVRWEYRKFMRVLWLLEKFAEKYALLLKCEIPGGGSKEKGNLCFHGLPKAHLDRINR